MEEKLTELRPLHPAEQLIQHEMLTLHSFTDLTPKSLSRLAVGVARYLPGLWLPKKPATLPALRRERSAD